MKYVIILILFLFTSCEQKCSLSVFLYSEKFEVENKYNYYPAVEGHRFSVIEYNEENVQMFKTDYPDAYEVFRSCKDDYNITFNSHFIQ